jgi:hypothetical protein
MKVKIAFDTDKTRNLSFQRPFPATTKCCRCKSQARLAFVAHELQKKRSYWKKKKGYYWAVCHLWPNKKKNMWLHDLCAVAIYFCKKCLEPTALYNQG